MIEPLCTDEKAGTALECLQSIRSWVEKDMQWSWNAEVPKDCIYMAW